MLRYFKLWLPKKWALAPGATVRNNTVCILLDWKTAINDQLQLSEGKKRTATYRVCVGGGFLQSRTG